MLPPPEPPSSLPSRRRATSTEQHCKDPALHHCAPFSAMATSIQKLKDDIWYVKKDEQAEEAGLRQWMEQVSLRLEDFAYQIAVADNA